MRLLLDQDVYARPSAPGEEVLLMPLAESERKLTYADYLRWP